MAKQITIIGNPEHITKEQRELIKFAAAKNVALTVIPSAEIKGLSDILENNNMPKDLAIDVIHREKSDVKKEQKFYTPKPIVDARAYRAAAGFNSKKKGGR